MTNSFKIDDLIAELQFLKAEYGNLPIEVTDGYHRHAFSISPKMGGAWDSPSVILIRPLNRDGKQHTIGILEKASVFNAM